MPKELEGRDLTKAERLIAWPALVLEEEVEGWCAAEEEEVADILGDECVEVVVPEADEGGGGDRVVPGERGRWYPVFIAALMMRSLRQVRWGSSG